MKFKKPNKLEFKWIVFVVLVSALAFAAMADKASSQEPIPDPLVDIVLLPDPGTGEYTMTVVVPTRATNDEAVDSACCYRVDLPDVLLLGCEPRVDTEDGLRMAISFPVTIPETPGLDGEVRCYTINPADQSDESLNAYIIPFPLDLKPNAPTVR